MTDIKNILTPEEEKSIVDHIRKAEKNTSGEIRIHMEDHCKGELMDRATEIFDSLEMQKTKDRNGVLLYFAVKDHQVAVLGDKGINAVVDDNYWDEKLEEIVAHFKEGKFYEGIAQTVSDVGGKLTELFPVKSNDRNELPDDISYES